MKTVFSLILSVLPFFYSYADEYIVLYRVSEKNPAYVNQFRKYLNNKGYRVNVYEKANKLVQHLENVNKINKEKASLLLAIDFNIGDENRVLVAVTDARREKGRFLSIEEVPALYLEASKAVATLVASSLNTKVKQFPIFLLLGIDMPGILLIVECTKENINHVFDALYEGLQKYYGRSTKT